MKTFIALVIFGVVTLSLAYSCRPRDHRVVASLQVTYTDGTTGNMTFSGRHFGKPSGNRLFLSEGCIRFHTSHNGGHQDVVCGVRKFTVENYQVTKIE